MSADVIAKYLEDMEHDDFEFIEGSAQQFGQGHRGQHGQAGQEGQEPDWSWGNLGEKEEHVIPIVMVSSEADAPAAEVVSVRHIPIRVEGGATPLGSESPVDPEDRPVSVERVIPINVEGYSYEQLQQERQQHQQQQQQHHQQQQSLDFGNAAYREYVWVDPVEEADPKTTTMKFGKRWRESDGKSETKGAPVQHSLAFRDVFKNCFKRFL